MKSAKERNKDHSIVRMLWQGMLLLIVCMIACMSHVLDLRITFEAREAENYMNALDTAAAGIEEQFNQEIETVNRYAQVVEDSGIGIEDYAILKMLTDMSLSDSEQVAYVTADGVVYSATDKTVSSSLGNTLFYNSISEITDTAIMEDVLYYGSKKSPKIVIVAPVNFNGNADAYVLVWKSMDAMFDDPVFSYLRTHGEIGLTDQNGVVITGQNEEGSLIKTSTNVFDTIEEYSNKKSKYLKTIIDMKQELRLSGSSSCCFTSMGDKTIAISGMAIPGYKEFFLIGYSNVQAVEEAISGITIRSVFVYTFIIVLMIGMIFYVWTHSKQSNTTIEKLAYEDLVTGAKNYNYFCEKAAEFISRYHEIPYLIERFDIANFRYINEAYGHDRANELLKECINIPSEGLSERELCVRMDSDQFVAITRNDGKSDQRRQEFEKQINEFARTIGIKFPIRIKYGIYQVRKNDSDVEVMVDRANAAKKGLKNDDKYLIAYYSDAVALDMRKIDCIESEMEKALENGEFKVFLQPKWDIERNCAVGAEALVRWIKSDGTIIYPNDFIPIFEQNGFVERLDMYMLESVCKAGSRLVEEGKQLLPISINQSRVLLHNPEYVNNVSKILKRYQVPHEFIELEITETVFFNERDKMIEITNELKKLGVHLSMDDFGSGYTSLNLLKDIPFDVIKIDREFLSETITSNSSIIILQKVIEMAEGLGMKVICEGVETAEQIEIFKSVGCKLVQGYYYSKPIPRQEFEEKYIGEKN